MSDERFPKPDVPWFHEVYGRWHTPVIWTRDAVVHPSGEWEATFDLPTGPVCDEPHAAMAGRCRLLFGHDGPHLLCAGSGPLAVVSLRRVAPTERAS